jgi:hypothetical protein
MPPNLPASYPPIAHPYPHLEGLEGWLLVVGFGLVISPFQLAHTIMTGNIPLLTDPAHRALIFEHGGIAALALVAAGANVVFLVAILYLNYLFFTRSLLFPRGMILYYALRTCELLVLAVAFSAASAPPEFQGAWSRALRAVIGSAIWVPYFFMSRRVKVTFTR